MATKNMSDELARQSAFEAVYGTTFNQWVETKAITWVKEALGIPSYQSGRMALPKSSISKISIDKTAVRKNRNTRSLKDRALNV